MKLSVLLHETGIKCPEDIRDTAEKTEITGIAFDSRKVEEGNLFVCLTGEHTNGHIYAADAAWKGAAAVLTEEDIGERPFPVIRVESTRAVLARVAKAFYGNPAGDMRIQGVTGTNGKTTVTYMLQRIFTQEGRDCGVIGTIGYHVGAGSKDRDAGRTTPESFEIWDLLSAMHKNGLTDCAMEVSSHGLALGRVEGIEFDGAVFTNLTGDHMDFHKTMEDYYQAKKKLFYMTRGVSVVNLDDGYGARLCRELREDGKEVYSCSLSDPDADFYGKTGCLTERGSTVELYRRTGDAARGAGNSLLCELRLSVPGLFNVYNAVEAAACGVLLGIPPEDVAAALADFGGAPGRFELVPNDRDMTVIVDYAHTPDALENVLRTARSFTKGRLITVFGCGGDRDRSKRPVMGRIAGMLADLSIITSDNPRTESQEVISAEIEAGMKETGGRYEVIEGRKEAIERALKRYEPGDVIVIAGKGHETYQLIGGSKNYFSDRDTVRRALKEVKDESTYNQTNCAGSKGEPCQRR